MPVPVASVNFAATISAFFAAKSLPGKFSAAQTDRQRFGRAGRFPSAAGKTLHGRKSSGMEPNSMPLLISGVL